MTTCSDDEGINRQEHQLVYSYLPGKILAYCPSIPGQRNRFINGRVRYPQLHSTLSVDRDLNLEVGKKIRSLLGQRANGKSFVFYELDSALSPTIEIFPRVLEIHLSDDRKMLYWLEEEGTPTQHSGNLDNLNAILSREQVRGVFFTDLVFCDSRNEMGRGTDPTTYPVFQLGRPEFVDPACRALILGDENWRNRRIRFASNDEEGTVLRPLAIYPRQFCDYDNRVNRWFSTPKKARGRETYVPKIFDEVFYYISEMRRDIEPEYIMDWLSVKYGSDFGGEVSEEDRRFMLGNISALASESQVSPLKKDVLERILRSLNISDDVESVRQYVVRYKENIEYLRLLSIRKRVDALTPNQLEQKQKLPEWLEVDENSADRIARVLRNHGIEYLGPSNRVRIVSFVYGWMSGSYEDDNSIFQMPVNAQRNEWPILHYKFDSEGLLVGFDNDLLCNAFKKLGVIDMIQARRQYLHTLAHIMIKTLPVYCGLDAGMLGERIYYEGNYAALMIFSREPGEVKLGGIRDTLRRNLREWIDSWDTLINCPLEDEDTDGCHYCTYVANSCCDFNKNLSRRLVNGVFEEFKRVGGSQ